MATTVGVFGRGRLGSLIRESLIANPDFECAWSLGRDQHPSCDVDVAIDVSHPDAVADHVLWANDTATDLVIGTTSWPAHAVRGSGQFSGVLMAPNFSLSMALMRRFALVLGGYAQQSPEQVDLAVTETHHRSKVDAPSGSAALLVSALAAGSGRNGADIPTTSLRMGSVVGSHDIRFETPSEAMTISHEAHTRGVFATGALAAATWLNGRNGVFTIDDWATDQLDDLFTSTRSPPPPASPSPSPSPTSSPSPLTQEQP